MIMVNVLKRPESSPAWILESPLQRVGAHLLLFVPYFPEGPADTCMPLLPTAKLKQLWPSCNNTLD